MVKNVETLYKIYVDFAHNVQKWLLAKLDGLANFLCSCMHRKAFYRPKIIIIWWIQNYETKNEEEIFHP